jgi:hypothetical protein
MFGGFDPRFEETRVVLQESITKSQTISISTADKLCGPQVIINNVPRFPAPGTKSFQQIVSAAWKTLFAHE